MPTALLIHGSTQRASCWDLVAPLLEEKGHRPITVELPKDEPGWAIDDFADFIANSIPDDDDIIAVAHSASGMFLPAISERRRVHALIWLAAVLPLPGASIIDQVRAEPDMMCADWRAAGTRWIEPRDWPELAARFLFHDVPAERLAWAQTTVHPMRTDAALRTPAGNWGTAERRICVIATLDRTINPLWQERAWRERTGTAPVLVEAGHCPHVSVPEAVADIILASGR